MKSRSEGCTPYQRRHIHRSGIECCASEFQNGKLVGWPVLPPVVNEKSCGLVGSLSSAICVCTIFLVVGCIRCVNSLSDAKLRGSFPLRTASMYAGIVVCCTAQLRLICSNCHAMRWSSLSDGAYSCSRAMQSLTILRLRILAIKPMSESLTFPCVLTVLPRNSSYRREGYRPQPHPGGTNTLTESTLAHGTAPPPLRIRL